MNPKDEMLRIAFDIARISGIESMEDLDEEVKDPAEARRDKEEAWSKLNEARRKGEITREDYEESRALLDKWLVLARKSCFLSEPRNELDRALEAKVGVKLAKVSDSRVIIQFAGGEELNIEWDRDGLLVNLGNRVYSNPDGV